MDCYIETISNEGDASDTSIKLVEFSREHGASKFNPLGVGSFSFLVVVWLFCLWPHHRNTAPPLVGSKAEVSRIYRPRRSLIIYLLVGLEDGHPYRGVGVCACDRKATFNVQMSLLPSPKSLLRHTHISPAHCVPPRPHARAYLRYFPPSPRAPPHTHIANKLFSTDFIALL